MAADAFSAIIITGEFVLPETIAAVGLRTSVREFGGARRSVIALALLATGFLATFIITGLLWRRG
jgi:uncharacterized membrane protein YadS